MATNIPKDAPYDLKNSELHHSLKRLGKNEPVKAKTGSTKDDDAVQPKEA